MRRNFILASFAIVGLVACRNPSLDKQTQVREKPIETGQANPTTTSTPLAPTNPKIAQISNPESISGEVVRVEEDDIILNNGTQEIRVDADDDVLRQANLATGESITVLGDYDDNDFDAYRITRENGKTLLIDDE